MVGALSIIRFRTAIKDPMDLLFLFWSISIGIICGAGLYEIAIIMSVIATFGIIVFQLTPIKKDTYLLVINAKGKDIFDQLITKIKERTSSYSIKAKNINKDGMELIVEIRTHKENEKLLDELLELQDVEAVHLLENDVAVNN